MSYIVADFRAGKSPVSKPERSASKLDIVAAVVSVAAPLVLIGVLAFLAKVAEVAPAEWLASAGP